MWQSVNLRTLGLVAWDAEIIIKTLPLFLGQKKSKQKLEIKKLTRCIEKQYSKWEYLGYLLWNYLFKLFLIIMNCTFNTEKFPVAGISTSFFSINLLFLSILHSYQSDVFFIAYFRTLITLLR